MKALNLISQTQEGKVPVELTDEAPPLRCFLESVIVLEVWKELRVALEVAIWPFL